MNSSLLIWLTGNFHLDTSKYISPSSPCPAHFCHANTFGQLMLPGSTSGTWGILAQQLRCFQGSWTPPNGRFQSEFPVFQGWFSGSEPFIFCIYSSPIKKQYTQVILSPRPDNKFSIEFGSRLFSPSQNRSPSQKLPGKTLIPLGLAIITFILPREKSETKPTHHRRCLG